MIPFDEIDSRLDQLGLDRSWLAEKSGRSPSSIRSALAPNAHPKQRSELLQRALSDAIEREEAARRGRPAEPDENLIRVSFSDEDFAEIEAAAGIVQTPIKDFITRAAIHQARADLAKSAAATPPAVVPREPEPAVAYFPVPLLRAAAGFPILADAEVIEHDRELGEGRFLLELRGDSMEPRFQDRQRVVLRDKATLRRPLLKYGQLYCFIHDGAACFKQWAKDDDGRKVLRSLNPEHPDIPADEATEWIGWFDPADNG